MEFMKEHNIMQDEQHGFRVLRGICHVSPNFLRYLRSGQKMLEEGDDIDVD